MDYHRDDREETAELRADLAAAKDEVSVVRAAITAVRNEWQPRALAAEAALSEARAERDAAEKQRDGCRSDASRMGQLWEQAVKDWKAAERVRDEALAEVESLRRGIEYVSKRYGAVPQPDGTWLWPDLIRERDEARAEVETWKAKYIDARKSGYAEGLEEAAEAREALVALVRAEAGRHLGTVSASREIDAAITRARCALAPPSHNEKGTKP
jgi:DNA repair exonuclease SbcCD ATPase subunit